MTTRHSNANANANANDIPENRLTRLYAHYADRLNAGENLDFCTILKEHPEVGPDLVEELTLLQQLNFGASEYNSLGTFGDYTLRRQIGRGGMGVVYEAWQGSMDRVVALKVLPAGVAADDRACGRFMQEARAAGKLSHPNVVAVHASGQDEKTPYYAMEYVEGETLSQIIARIKDAESETETPFGRQDGQDYYIHIARCFADVADGLQHAHTKGVVHRDIKPSNLILDQAGRLRILDFGLARLEGQESLTQSGDCVGTPLYMSPEQARRRKVSIDHRTDIYSLGVTLYEMLTWQPPFKGTDHQDTLSQIISRDPLPPRKLNPRIPGDLETIVLKCLRKDAADRYGTAEALGQDVRRFVRGDPIEARPERQSTRLARWLRRSRRQLFVGVALLLFGAISLRLAFDVRQARQDRERAEYPAKVLSAAVKLAAGRFSLEASSTTGRASPVFAHPILRLPGSTRYFRFLAPVTTSDVRALIGDAELGSVSVAARELEQITAALPDQRDAHYHLARAYWLLGRSSHVRKELKRTLAIDPGFVPAQVLLREMGTGDVGPAPSEEPPNTDPGGWEGLWLAIRKGGGGKQRRREALVAYDQLIVESRRGEEPYIGFLLEAYLGRGAVRLSLGDHEGAEQDFAVARYLSPETIEAGLLLGKAYYLEGKKDLARRTFKGLLDGSPHTLEETKLWISTIFTSLREYTEALEWVAELENPSLRERFKAYLLLKNGDGPGAVEAGRRAVAADPENFIAHLLLGAALRRVLSDDRALEDDLILEFLKVAGDCVDHSPDSPAATHLVRTAQVIATRYLRCLSRRDSMTTKSVSIVAILALTANFAWPACLIDDFVADADLYDGAPLTWASPQCNCEITPVEGEGLYMRNLGSVEADLFTQDVFAGDISVEMRGTFNETDATGIHGSPFLSVFAHVDMTAGSGYYGGVRADGKLTLARFVNWFTSEWGVTVFLPEEFEIDLEEELAMELRAGPSEVPGDPVGAWRVELRVWRPSEGRPAAPHVLYLELNTPYANGVVGVGSRISGGNPACIYSVAIKNPPPCHASFRRGDSNADSALNIADAIFTLTYLFAAGPESTCLDTADSNDDGAVDIADAIAQLSHLFAASGDLPEPFGVCGADTTDDVLGCASYPPCE